MGNTVQKFGEQMTRLIEEGHPVRARNILQLVFRGYGKAIRYAPGSKDSPARRYLMSFCNDRMADSLRGEDRAVIVSLFTPCQPFEAMGIPVMIPEGLGCYMTASGCEKVFLARAEACGAPETLCSYHKMLIGMTESGVLPRPKMVVNTTLACDANQLSFRYLAEYFNVPHFVLDVPATEGEDALEYLTGQIEELIPFIEEHAGRRLDPAKLREVMSRSARSTENYRHALALKAKRQEVSRITFHMMDLLAMHILLGSKETLRYTEMLVKDLSRLPKGKKVPRILWVHTLPYWQPSVNDFFKYNDRAEVVCCDMNMDRLSDLDPDDPYRYLAN